jgi:hypothetical protein
MAVQQNSFTHLRVLLVLADRGTEEVKGDDLWSLSRKAAPYSSFTTTIYLLMPVQQNSSIHLRVLLVLADCNVLAQSNSRRRRAELSSI